MACKGLKKDGSACGMRPGAGQDFCLNHGGTKPERKPKAERQSEPAAKIAPKAPKASQDARSGDGWGIALGSLVGLALAGAAVYFAHRLAGKPQQAARPTLAAVG